MRLICGVVLLDGSPASPDILEAMLDALASPGLKHRVTRRVDGPAALGLLDFSSRIADDAPSRDKLRRDLPCGPDGTWLAADLRLDSPGDLSNTLGMPAAADEQTLALAALARWDHNVPDGVHGDFALAAWMPERRRMLCARDIMGVRPLCYTYVPGRLFAFASLPRGLHASGVVEGRLDPVSLGRVLIDSYYTDGSTGFKDIQWVPPGHSVVVTERHIRLHRAWKPDATEVGCWRGSAADAAAMLRTRVEEAVACRLPASGPVASHLSGGLDSSAITVVAARQLRGQGRPLYAFSMLSRDSSKPEPEDLPPLDERQYVYSVLAQERDIHWCSTHQPDLDEDGVFEPDFALAGPLADPDYRICAAAFTAGSELLLSGAGGDEVATYNGLAILPAMLREGCWQALLAELKARARRESTMMIRIMTQQLIFPMLPAWMAALRRHGKHHSRPGDRRRNALSFLRPDIASRVAASTPVEGYRPSSPEGRIDWLCANHLAFRGARWSILAARHGLAFSYPLADRRILEFGLSMPVERLADRGYARQPFRNAMTGILPESIRWRTTKFSAFPDLEGNLRSALPGLLAQIRTVRGSEAAESMFDLDAIDVAFRTASQQPIAPAPVLLPNGQPRVPRPIKVALHALRALTIAKYVARMAG